METFHLYFITLLSWLPVHLFQWWDGHGPAKNHSELSRISSAQEYWIEAPPGVKSSMKCKNYLPNICKPQCILSFCPLSSWASLGDCRGQSPSRSCCRSLSPDTSSPYHQPPPAAPGDITLAPEMKTNIANVNVISLSYLRGSRPPGAGVKVSVYHLHHKNSVLFLWGGLDGFLVHQPL